MPKIQTEFSTGSAPLLKLTNMTIRTPEGRMLFHDLNLVVEREQIAVIGRNGVGKSTLLNVLAGNLKPSSGNLQYKSKPYLVPQQVPLKKDHFPKLFSALLTEQMLARELGEAGLAPLSDLCRRDQFSSGEIRKLHLLAAKLYCPDMLLLDEPSEDLDVVGVQWLINWLKSWGNGLLVVSHDRLLLKYFEHFFIIKESGCDYFSGKFSEFEQKMAKDAVKADKRYLQKLNHLSQQEAQRAKVLKRRKRKKNYGRISELDRCTSRQRLNSKRSRAQVSQGKAARISQERNEVVRKWTCSGRRALAVNLELKLPISQLDIVQNRELIRQESVTAKVDDRFLFRDINLSLGYERLAIVGPNGAGKTTLLNIILGSNEPFSGKVLNFSPGIGAIAQDGTNWLTQESLLSLLMLYSSLQTIDEVTQLLVTQKFPLALANRPLNSLSPGERVRAALICLFQKIPEVHILILDEPTYSLDFVGETSLRAALSAWPGGLMITSHQKDFLDAIPVSKRLELVGNGEYCFIN